VTPGPEGSPLRVLHVLGHYPLPPLGGMEVAVVNVSLELARLGVDTRVIGAAPADQSEQVSGVTFLGVPAIRLTNWIRFARRSAKRTLEVEIARSDLVHVHNPQELFNQFAARIALRQGRPLCLSLLSPNTLRQHPNPIYRVLGLFAERRVRTLSRRAQLIHVKNERDLDTVRGWNANVRLFPDGLPPPYFTQPKGGSSFRREHGISDARPVLLYLGRLHPMKGPDQLIRALPHLLPQFPTAVAVIAGPDPDKMTPGLARLSHDLGVDSHVRLVGRLEEAKKLDAIDGCDVVVIPSVSDFVEGFSIAASEAWARGKPVAAYPVGALAVRVKDGKNGGLARAVTPSDLANAILTANRLGPVTSPPDVVSWEVVAAGLADAYREILGTGATPSKNERGTARAQAAM
jgi:glycosyltransferase involved in cell wall biosynthesis